MNTSLESLGSLLANSPENEAPDSVARLGGRRAPHGPWGLGMFRVLGFKFREYRG